MRPILDARRRQALREIAGGLGILAIAYVGMACSILLAGLAGRWLYLAFAA